MKKLIIFDLDGTLLNTIADLAHSTNHALQTLGYPTHEVASYNFMVGNGINKLFERALPEGEKTEENVLRVRKEFLLHYDRHNADESRPYPGIPELLETLQHKGYKLAVASNKYQAATEKLIAHYFPGIRFVAVFGRILLWCMIFCGLPVFRKTKCCMSAIREWICRRLSIVELLPVESRGDSAPVRSLNHSVRII